MGEIKKNVLVVHRDEVQATILAIDAAHKLADLSFEFWRVGKSRGCNLNKDDPTYPLRIIVQQLRERAQLLYDPLDNVQLIASNDDLFPGVELEEGLQFRLNAGTRAKNEIVSKRRRMTRTLYETTHRSRKTRSASTPTGVCMTAATWPCTSIPRAATSYPQTRTHDDVKCRE
jgi:hypothetical protein